MFINDNDKYEIGDGADPDAPEDDDYEWWSTFKKAYA
jgi:hypothetical protein